MRHIYKTLGFLIFMASSALGQQVFEIQVDSSEFKTELADHIGRFVKILTTDTRLVVLDLENQRILFHKKGATLEDSQLIKVVGEFAHAQQNEAYNEVSHNRLSWEFGGIIFNDMLWITNYSYGEILKFDLDGNHLGSIDERLKVLDTNDSSLYAFEGQGVYRYDSVTDSFTYLKDFPELVELKSEMRRGRSNVKIGSNRLGIKHETDSLKVYNFADFLNNESTSVLFATRDVRGSDFEFTADKIVWSTSYTPADFLVSDLNGANVDTAVFDNYVYSFNFSDSLIYAVGPRRFWRYDSDMNLVESMPRSSFYTSLTFQGADSIHIYFWDQRDGGIVFAPVNHKEGTFFYAVENEIEYSGLRREFRVTDTELFLLSKSLADSFKVYRFDISDKSSSFFKVPQTNGIDIVGENIYTLSGKEVSVFSFDGDFKASFPLNDLANSNLSEVDSTSELFFAANEQKFFVGFGGKVSIFDTTGQFETMHDLNIKSPGHLFANEEFVYSTFDLGALEISTGNVFQFLDQGTPQLGYIYKDIYWHDGPGLNQYAYTTTALLTSVESNKTSVPVNFGLAQNYPNPFNPTTTIQFELPQASQVKLEVFNLRGQRMATLINEPKSAGTYFVDFDGGNLASGLYFYTLSAGNIKVVNKMLLVK